MPRDVPPLAKYNGFINPDFRLAHAPMRTKRINTVRVIPSYRGIDLRKIKEEIEGLRLQLLDMGKSNNLVNYQSYDDRSVRVVNSKPREVLTKLMEDPEGVRIISNKVISDDTDGFRSSSSQSEIDHALGRLMRTYLANYEDKGYTTVFASIGMMSWKENTSKYKAPVVLIPLELSRDMSGNVRLKWNGDDICVSPTFMVKLNELRMKIPKFDPIENADALETCLKVIEDAVEDRNAFKYANTIMIDVFDYSKSVMFNDADPAEWSDIPELIDLVLNPTNETRAETVERRIPSHGYSILDGDESQMSVVMDVLDGKSVVVEGPPGTGKSQTIANIIAECLGNEKTVLFVSDKMAALSVVKNRLDQFDLSTYVLEMHSDNTNRKNFLKEIERSMNRELAYEVPSELECNRLERVRQELDAFSTSMSQTLGARNLTPYQLIGMRELALNNIKRRKRNPARAEITDPLDIDDEEWDNCLSLVRIASDAIPAVMPIKKNFWKNCCVKDLTPSKEYSLRDIMANNVRRTDETLASSRELAKIIGVDSPQTIGDIAELNDICKNILQFGCISLSEMIEGNPETYESSCNSIIAIFEEGERIRSELAKRYKKKAFDLESVKLMDEFAKVRKGKKDADKERCAEIIKELETCSIKPFGHPDNLKDLVAADLENLAKFRGAIFLVNGDKAKSLFGDTWKSGNSDVSELKAMRDWVMFVKQNIASKRFSDTTALVIARGGAGTPLEVKYNEIGAGISDMLSSIKAITDILGMDEGSKFKSGIYDLKPMSLKKWIKDIGENLDSLRAWGNYCDIADKLSKTPARCFVEMLANGEIHPLDAVDTFTFTYSNTLIAEAVNTRQELRNFSFDAQELRVKDLKELDPAVLKINGQKLRKKLFLTSAKRMEDEAEEIRILKGEFNRGTGQMSVRKIMGLAGKAIQSIKPCFMMSPRSVAQYLSNRNMRFDVVIFDEASQVIPADSLGALMRGKQAVIMGDSKQLPPTSFFGKKEEGTAEAATAKDMESLLNLCRASLPVHVLSWHYRSKHDSLMALSNRLFYDDKLMVCPSPAQAPAYMGLKLHYVRTAVYQRGTTSSNVKEAEMIARAVWHHYIDYPEKSLGVVTFNTNQQKVITEEVERIFKRHPDARANMAKHVKEPFIIRNLENIQGDERDVMFISIGYGYDSDGKLSKSFGLLNHAGGERRLNVLMTRARELSLIFSNFKSMDMGLSDNVPEGVRALRAYLEYAELGYTSQLDTAPIKDDLAESISSFLISKGVKTVTNVGTSQFRIDIAVCSPSDPSSYILGICLDGRTYQRMQYTRDRDRTFMELLGRMGWNTYRIWSMDWYSNPDSAKRRLWNKVSGILGDGGKKVAYSTEMFEKVSEIVESESPICRERLHAVLKEKKISLTVKVKTDIEEIIAACVSMGRFTDEDSFVTVSERPVAIRKREPKGKWKPEWIHPQEYVKALREYDSEDIEERLTLALDKMGLPNKPAFREYANDFLNEL
jgi:hypothetical protein